MHTCLHKSSLKHAERALVNFLVGCLFLGSFIPFLGGFLRLNVYLCCTIGWWFVFVENLYMLYYDFSARVSFMASLRVSVVEVLSLILPCMYVICPIKN